MKKLKSFLSKRLNWEDFVEDKRSSLQMRHIIMDMIGCIEEGFALYDKNDRLVLWNDQLLHMFPSIKDLAETNATFAELEEVVLDVGDVALKKEQHQRWVQMRLRQRKKNHSQAEYQLSDGRWLQVTDRHTEHGNAISIFRDITESKTREEKLRAAKEMAETASHTKSTFLAHVSHELRTPLNAIIGFSEMMTREMFGPMTNVQYKTYVSDIYQSAQHLLGLIDDILNVSKAEVGHLEVHESTFSMAEIAMQIERMLEIRVKNSGVQLEVQLAPHLPLLYADERKIKQILINLLVNAIKFTPEGGTVRLSIQVNEKKELILQVEDTGIGMEAKDIPRALEAFGQIENTLTRKYDGSGLGLYLTSIFVKLHGGHMNIHSKKGKGTLVNITLPSRRCMKVAA